MNLLAIFEKKRRAIAESNVVGLEAVLCREEEIVTSISRLKASTASILEKFAERFAISPDDTLMKTIAASLEQKDREQFTRILSDLTDTAQKIASHDATRASLLKSTADLSNAAAQARILSAALRTRKNAHTLSTQPA